MQERGKYSDQTSIADIRYLCCAHSGIFHFEMDKNRKAKKTHTDMEIYKSEIKCAKNGEKRAALSVDSTISKCFHFTSQWQTGLKSFKFLRLPTLWLLNWMNTFVKRIYALFFFLPFHDFISPFLWRCLPSTFQPSFASNAIQCKQTLCAINKWQLGKKKILRFRIVKSRYKLMERHLRLTDGEKLPQNFVSSLHRISFILPPSEFQELLIWLEKNTFTQKFIVWKMPQNFNFSFGLRGFFFAAVFGARFCMQIRRECAFECQKWRCDSFWLHQCDVDEWMCVSAIDRKHLCALVELKVERFKKEERFCELWTFVSTLAFGDNEIKFQLFQFCDKYGNLCMFRMTLFTAMCIPMAWPHWLLIGTFPRTKFQSRCSWCTHANGLHRAQPANICEYGNLPNRMQYFGGDRVNGKCHYTIPNDEWYKQCKALPFFLLLCACWERGHVTASVLASPLERSRRQLRMVFSISICTEILVAANIVTISSEWRMEWPASYLRVHWTSEMDSNAWCLKLFTNDPTSANAKVALVGLGPFHRIAFGNKFMGRVTRAHTHTRLIGCRGTEFLVLVDI